MSNVRNRRIALTVAGAAGFAALVLPTGPGSASCAGPSLERVDGAAAAPRPTLVRGEVVAVAGRAFVDGCDDTGGGSTFLGCTHREAGETETPLHDVALTLRQHGRTWRLGRADAGSATDGRLGHVLWKVHVPRELRPGRAVLRAKGARLVVTISAPG